MHPIGSMKFTDGELNNARESDLYQRDHGHILRKELVNGNSDYEQKSDEENSCQ
jgi:hypothetical protein